VSESHSYSATLPDLPATIHMIGIGGIGVSGLARILHQRGYTVTGSDLSESPVIDDLRQFGLAISIGHRAENLGSPDLVVTTAAAHETNPELAAARDRGIPIIKRAALLGQLSAARTCIAVAGSHGKSTTAGMLAWALSKAGADPSYAVGAIVPQLGSNAGPGEGPHFVVEADEYDYSFLTLQPDVAIVTNIEFDHPDLFPDLAAVDAAFERFIGCVRDGGTLITSADDPGVRRVLDRMASRTGSNLAMRPVTVGRSDGADWRLDDSRSPAVVYGPDGCRFRLDLSIPGPHNRMNAAMALAAGFLLDVDLASALSGIEKFAGVGRRFELRGRIGDIPVFDDYAHHPTELRATIAAARERYPGRRICTVFQPHTYSRTRELLAEFAQALDDADRVYLVEIYPARETDTLGVSSGSIARLMHLRPSVFETPQAVATAIADDLDQNDVVLFLGAGDIWQGSRALLAEMESRTEIHG
jgi:UDP-N-acetylmuramate--alanine ligase